MVSWRPKTNRSLGNSPPSHKKKPNRVTKFVVVIKYMYNQEYMQIIWTTHIQHKFHYAFGKFRIFVFFKSSYIFLHVRVMGLNIFCRFLSYLLVSKCNDKLSSLSYFILVMIFQDALWITLDDVKIPSTKGRWLFLKM